MPPLQHWELPPSSFDFVETKKEAVQTDSLFFYLEQELSCTVHDLQSRAATKLLLDVGDDTHTGVFVSLD